MKIFTAYGGTLFICSCGRKTRHLNYNSCAENDRKMRESNLMH